MRLHRSHIHTFYTNCNYSNINWIFDFSEILCCICRFKWIKEKENHTKPNIKMCVFTCRPSSSSFRVFSSSLFRFFVIFFLFSVVSCALLPQITRYCNRFIKGNHKIHARERKKNRWLFQNGRRSFVKWILLMKPRCEREVKRYTITRTNRKRFLVSLFWWNWKRNIFEIIMVSVAEHRTRTVLGRKCYFLTRYLYICIYSFQCSFH